MSSGNAARGHSQKLDGHTATATGNDIRPEEPYYLRFWRRTSPHPGPLPKGEGEWSPVGRQDVCPSYLSRRPMLLPLLWERVGVRGSLAGRRYGAQMLPRSTLEIGILMVSDRNVRAPMDWFSSYAQAALFELTGFFRLPWRRSGRFFHAAGEIGTGGNGIPRPFRFHPFHRILDA
jgi:hypothetical protein